MDHRAMDVVASSAMKDLLERAVRQGKTPRPKSSNLHDALLSATSHRYTAPLIFASAVESAVNKGELGKRDGKTILSCADFIHSGGSYDCPCGKEDERREAAARILVSGIKAGAYFPHHVEDRFLSLLGGSRDDTIVEMGVANGVLNASHGSVFRRLISRSIYDVYPEEKTVRILKNGLDAGALNGNPAPLFDSILKSGKKEPYPWENEVIDRKPHLRSAKMIALGVKDGLFRKEDAVGPFVEHFNSAFSANREEALFKGGDNYSYPKTLKEGISSGLLHPVKDKGLINKFERKITTEHALVFGKPKPVGNAKKK